jgi:hypothetical protein
MTTHDRQCPLAGSGSEHSDPAKRVYDNYHLHRTADYFASLGKWIAVALQDGASDGVLYDSKSDAIHHQHHNEQWYAYIQITPANMTVCSAEIYLGVIRRLYDKGLRMVDPDHRGGGPELIKRASYEDQLALARLRPTNIRVPRN